jgi:hypothetical protein
MDRRTLLKQIAILTGGAVLGGEVFLSTGCKTGPKNLFSAAQLALLDEVGETILPKSDTPGAKDVAIAQFMQTIVADCYNKEQRDAFIKGMETLDEYCVKTYKKKFVALSAAERQAVVLGLEKEAKEFDKKVVLDEKALRAPIKNNDEKKSWLDKKAFDGLPRHYYTMIKQLTLWGYFSHKDICTKVLRFVMVPGKYDGAYPYAKGEKAWSV